MILEEGAGEENGTFTPADSLLGQNGDGQRPCGILRASPVRLRGPEPGSGS